MFNNRIGVICHLDQWLENGNEWLSQFDVECVQIQCFDANFYTDENVERVKELLGELSLEATSLWAGWSGPMRWDCVDGPSSIGIVPASYRHQRIQEIIKGVDFAHKLGIKNVATHMGFIPEYPMTKEYRDVVSAVRYIAQYCAKKDIYFNFETGQETPVTLMRTLKDTGCNNLGVNLDPANLITYGKGNPIDAVDIFKGYVRGVHIKDGDYTTDPLFYKDGEERLVGEGSVNYPVFLPKLINSGYKGDLYIEREISGEQQTIDIKKTITYIKGLLNKNKEV